MPKTATATKASAAPIPTDPTGPEQTREHWLVEMTGGLTLSIAIVSALSFWWLMLTNVLLA